jgi:hypothetical protein
MTSMMTDRLPRLPGESFEQYQCRLVAAWLASLALKPVKGRRAQ